MEIETIIEEWDPIDIDNNEEVVNYVNKHYSQLINCDSDAIELIDQISDIFGIYFYALAELHNWTEIIDKHDNILLFVNRLRGRHKDYNDVFCDIKIVYTDAILAQTGNIVRALKAIRPVHNFLPHDEDVMIRIQQVKHAIRQRIYSRLITGLGLTGLLLLIVAFVTKHIVVYNSLRIFVISFFLVSLTKHFDRTLSNKKFAKHYNN